MHSLPLFHRIAGQPVIVLGEGDQAEAKARLVERAGGRVVGKDDPEARLAFVALEDPEAAAAALKARGVLVNVADRPDLCDFTLPSVLDRDPVVIAVSTGGASAGLAKALRLRLEGLLPSSLGALARGLFAARDTLRSRWPDANQRRHALDEALGESGPLDPFGDASAGRLAGWLKQASSTHSDLVEFRISSADPDDLTLRQARWLGRADRVVFEAGIAPAVLDRARADAVRIAIADGAEAVQGAGLIVVIRRG